MKPGYIVLFLILIILVVLLLYYSGVPAFGDLPLPDLDFGFGAIGRMLTEIFEGIARSIKF